MSVVRLIFVLALVSVPAAVAATEQPAEERPRKG